MIPRPMTLSEQREAHLVVHTLLQKVKKYAESRGAKRASVSRKFHDGLMLMVAMQQAEQFLKTLETENRWDFKTWLKAFLPRRIQERPNSKASGPPSQQPTRQTPTHQRPSTP